MNWILIYWIIGGYSIGGGFQTNTTMFADKAACEAAVQQLADAWATRGPNGVYGVAGGTCSQSATPVVVVPK